MPLGYLDGNTGSLLATLLVGGTAGAAVAARSARARVSGALGRKKKGADAPDESPATAALDDAGTDMSAAPGPDEAAPPAGPPEASPGA
jgi:hypothetical protein